MSDIKNEIYKSEAEHLEISLYRIDTLQQLIHSLQEEKFNFITTIETQNSQIESLKAIIELAVKENERLKKIQQLLIFNKAIRELTPMKKFALVIEMMGDSFWDNEDAEIERLQNE